jgi:hypothetical protein
MDENLFFSKQRDVVGVEPAKKRPYPNQLKTGRRGFLLE